MQTIISAISDFGLVPGDIITDGKIHRCHSAAKDKRNRDGWYIIHEYQGHFYAAYGCWIRNEKRKTSTKDSTGDKKGAEIGWQMLHQKHNAEELERLENAKKTVANFIKKHTIDPDPQHAYLINKGVGIYGNMRMSQNSLIIPVYNVAGQATSYQVIRRNGGKRFLYSGVVSGGCYPIPGNDGTICICEGYATGATIHEATGFKVLVAFNAGNMEQVTGHALKMFKHQEILICADNDHGTEKDKGFNPGILAAKKIKDKYGLGYVYPDDIDGTDFNDMAAELGLDAVKKAIFNRQTIECMEQKDCQAVDESLKIPDDLPLPGLIGQGLEALEGDILQYSLPLVLTVISRAIAGKISINNVWPNVFNIKVGGTSTGKSATDKKFVMCLGDLSNFISMNEVASGAGIWRAVSENPRGMGMFDEISSVFIRNNAKGGIDINAESKSTTFCDLFSRSGQCFSKRYGDAKNSIDIQFPCVSVIGNATPTIFESIQPRDFETGLMQRFDFWVYGGKIKPKPLVLGSSYRSKTIVWVTELRKLLNVKPDLVNLGNTLCENVDLGSSSEAFDCIKNYSAQVIEKANTAESEGRVGFISRRFDLALKYALIHHAAVKRADKIYEQVEAESIKWGITIAELLSSWKVDVLESKVTSGDFHKDCEIFKAAILAAVKTGKSPTFKYMATRKAKLKDWTPKKAEEIITVLKKRGEIITREGKGNVTMYYLPKNYEA